MIIFFHPRILIVLIVFFLSCCGTPPTSLDFIYFRPDGFSNGRSIHFLIYENPNKVRNFALSDGGSPKELKNVYLLNYLPSIIKEIDTKKAIEYRYEVLIQQSNGERKEFLLNKDWIPVIKEIRKHVLHDKLRTLYMDRLLYLMNTFPDGIKSHKDAPVPGIIKK